MVLSTGTRRSTLQGGDKGHRHTQSHSYPPHTVCNKARDMVHFQVSVTVQAHNTQKHMAPSLGACRLALL
jgi:hypothetical protein